MQFRPYTPDWEPAVVAFNDRLRARGFTFSFPQRSFSAPTSAGETGPPRAIFEEAFLATDQAGQVRGGYVLKHQEFTIRGVSHPMVVIRLPLSEGVVDDTYAALGISLITNALSRYPVMAALGMGGMRERLPLLLKALRWTLLEVPFYFRVLHVKRFLANIEYLKRTRALRTAIGLAAVTGAGWLCISALQNWHRKPVWMSTCTTEVVSRFDAWADHVWDSASSQYSLIGSRTSGAVNHLYPSGRDRFLRLRVSDQSGVIGWALVLDTQMTNHRQFGAMRVGSIVDGLSSRRDATRVIAAASRFLRDRGVDLVVSNQMDAEWGRALYRAGFSRGPSNFVCGLSPELAARLRPIEHHVTSIHLNRGDGDGPINL